MTDTKKDTAPSVATVDTEEFRDALFRAIHEEIAMHEGYHVSGEARAALIAHIDAHVAAQVASKQAEIDRLMLEYCPAEMSAEQMKTWEASQRRAPEPSPAPVAMTDEQIETLRKLLACCEILDKRPRPMCRDCADECGTCPHDGLQCDIRKLFADARAILAAQQEAAARAKCSNDGGQCGIGGYCDDCHAAAPVSGDVALPELPVTHFSLWYSSPDEPPFNTDDAGYSATQMRTYGQQCSDAALERAAKLADDKGYGLIANRIRALKGGA